MGLFDKLVKEGTKVLNEVASDENKEKAASFLKDMKSSLDEVSKEILTEENKEKAAGFLNSLKEAAKDAARNTETSTYKEEYYTQSPEEEAKTARQKILEVLADEFPDYTVRENVRPEEFGAEGRLMDYSIVVYAGDQPKLIMMLVGKTTTSHREYRFSREAAEARGIPFINFVNHYPNTKEYITERLHKYL